MLELIEKKGLRFVEIEDSICVIGWASSEFGRDPMYDHALYEADQMREVVKQYWNPESIEIWEKRRKIYSPSKPQTNKLGTKPKKGKKT